VIVGQPLQIVLKRIQTIGGNDTGLPHGSAYSLLYAPGSLDKPGTPGENSTYGSTQPL